MTFEEAEATEDNGEWLITFTGWGEVSDGRGRRPAAGDVFTGQIGPWRIGDDPIWQFHSGDVYTNATFQPATRLQAPAEPVRR